MARKRVAPGALIPVAYQTITLANSTAVGLNTTVRATGQVLDISVETQSVRFRADGTDPTLSTGVLIPTGLAPYRLDFNKTSALTFQRTTGTATVSVMAWRYD
jgi:hypothetical protein